jgi:hypothetical protein
VIPVPGPVTHTKETVKKEAPAQRRLDANAPLREVVAIKGSAL